MHFDVEKKLKIEPKLRALDIFERKKKKKTFVTVAKT